MKTYRKSEAAIAELDAEQYRVTQESGSERPGTGKYLHNHEPGIYVDVVSGESLFASSDKFEVTTIISTGWRMLEWHKNAQCSPAVASGVCRT